MTNVSRAMLSLLVILTVTLVGPSAGMLWPVGSRSAVAAPNKDTKDPKKDAKNTKPGTAAASAHKMNACGCYQDSTGACFCGRKGAAKCVCPGQCEPKGCDEKRAKEIEREIKTETKRAQDSERKQKAASKSKPAGATDEEDRQDKQDKKDRNAAANGSREKQ